MFQSVQTTSGASAGVASVPPSPGAFTPEGGGLDPRLNSILESAFAPPPLVPSGFVIPFARLPQSLAALTGLFTTSSAEFFLLRLTFQVDSRVGQPHMELASRALEQTGFKDFDRSWDRYQKSSFILGAARVGEFLRDGEITKDQAAGYLQKLAVAVAHVYAKDE